YTFRFKASYGDACTATRELSFSVHVDPGVDPSQTVVTVNVSRGRGTVTIVPKDKYGNNVGPGRGDGFTVSGIPGTTIIGQVVDNGDGSYTVPVSVDPSSVGAPGVVIGQPGRPPVIVRPPGTGKVSCRKWKILFWIALLVAIILLLLLILS